MAAQLAKLSRHHDLAKAINYMLWRWHAFTRFLDEAPDLPARAASTNASAIANIGITTRSGRKALAND